MKKQIFLLLLIAFCLPVCGQNSKETRKVAILETVDKEGNIAYGVKLLVRSNLALAITNTPGYEGYDRVDVASIMGEQDFQRTGMVNDEQIRKLGEMTGASDILVAEVAMINSSRVLITAKILDVESAQLRQTAYVQTNTSPAELEKGCRQVADQLLGIEKTKSPAKEKEKAEKAPKAVKEPKAPKVKKEPKYKPRYMGYVDAGYAYESNTLYSAVEVSTSHGCLIIPHLYVGAGLQVRYHYAWDSSLSIPVFINLRGIYPTKKVSPFFDLKAGYALIDRGIYASPSIGISIKKHLDISLGYEGQKTIHKTPNSPWYSKSYLSFHFATFKLGVRF